MRHKAEWMRHPMRLELTLAGLQIMLANHYTIRGALCAVICSHPNKCIEYYLYLFKASCWFTLNIIKNQIIWYEFCNVLCLTANVLYPLVYIVKFSYRDYFIQNILPLIFSTAFFQVRPWPSGNLTWKLQEMNKTPLDHLNCTPSFSLSLSLSHTHTPFFSVFFLCLSPVILSVSLDLLVSIYASKYMLVVFLLHPIIGTSFIRRFLSLLRGKTTALKKRCILDMTINLILW